MVSCHANYPSFSSSLPHPLQANWHFHFKIASQAPLWIESNYAEKHQLILSEHNSFHHLSQSQQVSLFLKYLLNPVQEVIVTISLFQNGWMGSGIKKHSSEEPCRRGPMWDVDETGGEEFSRYMLEVQGMHFTALTHWWSCHRVYLGPKGPF